jgi:hypothetical protein
VFYFLRNFLGDTRLAVEYRGGYHKDLETVLVEVGIPYHEEEVGEKMETIGDVIK